MLNKNVLIPSPWETSVMDCCMFLKVFPSAFINWSLDWLLPSSLLQNVILLHRLFWAWFLKLMCLGDLSILFFFVFVFFSNGYIVLHKMNMPHPFLSQGVVRGAHPCPLYGFYFWKADNIAINIYPPILAGGGGECVPNIFTNKITRSNGMHFSFCLMLSKKLLPYQIV